MISSLVLLLAAALALTPVPQSTDPAHRWQKRLAQKAELIAKGGAPVVFVGDQIPGFFEEGWGGKNTWKHYWQAAPYSALNLGFSGDMTEHVLWRVTEGKELEGYEAKAVVIAVGQNNLKQRGDKPDDCIAGIEKIVEAVKTKQPQAGIVLCAICPQFGTKDTVYLNKVAKVNEGLAQVAQRQGVIWCGFDRAVQQNEEGYMYWTSGLVPKVNEALRGGKAPTYGTVKTVPFRPKLVAGAINADLIIDAKRFVEKTLAADPNVRIILCATGNPVVDREVMKYADGRSVIWCGEQSKAAVKALRKEASAKDALPVGPLIPLEFIPAPVDGQIAATTPVTRIRQTSWRGDDWWGDRLARNRDLIKANKKGFDLVLAGDSITHFWESMGAQNFAVLSNRYSCLNCGYGGDQTQEVLWRFQNGELDGYSAKVVMLMIGTNNNGINDYKPENTAKGVRACLDEILRRQPQAKIFLMAYLPRAVGHMDGVVAKDKANARNLKTTEIIREFADGEKIIWIDLYENFLENGILPKRLMEDMIHPTEEGYAIWRKAIEPKLKTILGV